jgi:hypothetical protein
MKFGIDAGQNQGIFEWKIRYLHAFLGFGVMVSFRFCHSCFSLQSVCLGVSCETLVILGISIVPSPLPNSLVLQELEMAPVDVSHIPSIPPVCTCNVPYAFLFLMQSIPLL